LKLPIVLLFVILAVSASAATVSISPTSVYETTSIWEIIDVDNYGGNSVVEEIAVDSPDLTITDIKDYSGWTAGYDSDEAGWEDGSVETNVNSAWFEFEVTAPNITSDTTAEITVSLDGGAGTTFNISVLNDATPPNISFVYPTTNATNLSHSYIEANVTAMEVTKTMFASALKLIG